MGTKYTYDGTTTTSSAGFTKPTLTGSTIANYQSIEDDPYLRVLSAKNGGTFNNILVTSGGTMFLSGGADVTSLTIAGASGATATASRAYVRMSGGGVVNSLTMSGGSFYGFGAKVYDIYVSGAATNDGRATISLQWADARLSRGYVQNATVNLSRGYVESVTFDTDTYVNLYGSGYVSGAWIPGMYMRSCTIQNGGQVRLRQSGGWVSSTTFNNATLDQYCLGDIKNLGKDLTFTNGARYNNGLTSGSTKFLGGSAVNLTFTNAAYMNARDGAIVSGASFDGKSYLQISGGANVKDVTLTDSSYVKVSSGGVLQSVTIGNACKVYVEAGGNKTSSGGAAIDVTIQNGGLLTFSGGAWQASAYDHLASRVTVEAGGSVILSNYAMLMDVSAGAGAKIYRTGTLNGFGGENTNIAKGVWDYMGDNFEVVNGTATGLRQDGNSAYSGVMIHSGLTVKDAVVASGGSLYLWDGAKYDGIDVYGSKADKGAYLWVSGNNIQGSNIRISSGGLISAFGGAVLSNVSAVESGATILLGGGTISGLQISGGAALKTVNGVSARIYGIEAGRRGGDNNASVYFSSGAYVSGGSIYEGATVYISGAVVENVYFGSNTWNNVYSSASILGGTLDKNADLRLALGQNKILVSGMLITSNAKINARSSDSLLRNIVVSGTTAAAINLSAGVISSATVVKGNITMSAGLTLTSKAIASDTLVRTSGYLYQSGGTMTNTVVNRGGSAFYMYDDIDSATDGITVQKNLTLIGNGSDGNTIASGTLWGYIYGGIVSGGSMRRATIMISGGKVDDVTYGEYTFINNSAGVEVNRCVGSDGAVIRGRGATFNSLTLTDSGKFEFSAGTANDVTLISGGTMWVSSGANVTLNGVTASNGGILRLYKGATATDATIMAGGTMYISGLAKVTGITAEAGAYIGLDLSSKTAGSANFDNLANVGRIDVINYNPANGTYTLADTGNTSLKVGIAGSRVFDGEVAAGSSWVNPLIEKTFTLNAAGTELGVAGYTRTSTGVAATFAQSGTVINGGDKELQWEVASIAAPVTLIEAAGTVTKNAWLDIHTCTADAGATIFGVAQNVDFANKLSYQLHGGNKLANVAFGANYGGSVKGVDILSYNTVYTGVGYAGGFGTVGADGIEVVFASNCVFQKDFYAGALANYAKTGERTSVSSIRASIGESAGQVGIPAVKGNFYAGGAVKAGNFETTAATNALQTVGDITLTLNQGAMDDGKCVFAGGYATGHDTAKLAPVYTVDSVTVNVNGGTWGTSAKGGRGIFGGAFAGDNLGTGGVYAQVGDVDITIAGGTMTNVFGGGWAQKGAKSEVGDVSITVKDGTMANIFGGGTTSTSGGSTVAGNVTITVSGGTINGAIYAMGQSANDAVNSAAVIFTGANDFDCGVYGYSYVGGAVSDATLAFSKYTGTFSGAIGGFNSINVEGNTWMTLGTAAEDVSNTAWTFDFEERDLGLDGNAALTWTTADFSDDTITLKIASTRSEGWTLVSGAAASAYNTATGKFQVEIDDEAAVSLTFDSATGKTDTIASGDYAGWGFAVENSVLKFTKLA